MTGGKADPGAGVARNMARVLTEAVVNARGHLLPKEQGVKYEYLTAWLEQLESEMTPMMGELLAPLLENDATPDRLRGMLSEMAAPSHQFNVILQIFGAIAAAFAAIGALGSIEVRELANELNATYKSQVLSPADAAELVERGLAGQEWATGEAAKSGVSADRFALMVEAVGEPPGPVDLLSLWRRGLISEDFLDQAILFSRIKDMYIPTIKLLAHSYMTPADVIELTIKGVVSPDVGAQMFAIAGGLPEQFDQLYIGAGDAIGAVAVLNLWNHGLASEADVDATLGRSRINPIFYPLAKQQRHRFLQPYQVEQILKAGGATPQQATQWLIEDGFAPDQVAAFVGAGTSVKAATVHRATEALVIDLYKDRMIDGATAAAQLVALGYPEQVALMYVELADAQVVQSQTKTAAAAVRSAFVAGKINRNQAQADLDALNIPPAAVTTWLDDWQVEATTKVKNLTTAQVGDMAKKGIVTYGYAMAFWEAEGYTTVMAELLAAHYGGGPLVNPDGSVTPFNG